MLRFRETGIASLRIGNLMKTNISIHRWQNLSALLCIFGLIACSGDGPEPGAKNVCGNGVIETGELCDGDNFPSGSASCEEMGFAGGELSCNASCTVVDTTNCLANSSDPSDVSDASDPTDATDPTTTTDPTDPEPEAECGNGVMETGETCDGLDLGGSSCETLGFATGNLACLDDCSGFDTSDCTDDVSQCGDGVIDEGELCDGEALGGVTCETVGYAGGTLGCQDDCSAYVLDGCVAESLCGNGIIDDGEVCDGDILAAQSCASLGYVSGTLACGEDCTAFDEAECWTEPPPVEEICGDGEIVGYEACDGDDLGTNEDGSALSCSNFFGQNLGTGVLSCTDTCTLDVAACGGDVCETFGLYDNTTCDRCDLWGGTADEDCTLCGAADGICRDVYEGSLGIWTCQSLGTPDPDCTCGNGVIEGSEFCDGTLFADDWATQECSLLGTATGTLGCTDDCRLDLSQCSYDVVPVCGDGVVQGDEVCDVDSLGDTTCESLGLPSLGPLRCANDCAGFDESGCYGTIPMGGVCGDVTLGTCDEGMECMGFGDISYCVKACGGSDDTETCGTDFECVEFLENNYCLERTALRDAPCYENGRSCAVDAGECRPTEYDYNAQVAAAYRCKPGCELSGDASQCSDGDTCLPDPLGFGEIQVDSPQCESDDACEPGFVCTELAGGESQCFKRNGLCGDSVPACLSIDPEDWTNCAADVANQCSLGDGHAYCVDPVSATPGVDPGFALCVDLGGTGLCFNFCENTSGVELDCGPGAVCERPSEVVLYLDVARDASGNYAPCATADDCVAYNTPDDSAYDCTELTIGNYCARPLKQCVAAASTP